MNKKVTITSLSGKIDQLYTQQQWNEQKSESRFETIESQLAKEALRRSFIAGMVSGICVFPMIIWYLITNWHNLRDFFQEAIRILFK